MDCHPHLDREEKRREKFSRTGKKKTEKKRPLQEEPLAKEWQVQGGPSTCWLGNQQETRSLEETLAIVCNVTAVAESGVEEYGRDTGRQLADRRSARRFS